MQNKNILVKLVSILFLLGVMWLFFLFSKNTLEKTTHNISTYLPEKTEWLIELNTEQLIEKGIESVLFAQLPDKEINTLISDLIIDQKEKNISIDEIGINPKAPIYIFNINRNGIDFTCGIFELKNAQKFQKNSPVFLSKPFQSFNNDDIGLIIYDPIRGGDEIANEILNNHTSPKEPTVYSTHFNTTSTHTKSTLDFSILDSSILINGNFRIKDASIAPTLSLLPKGFHFSSRYIPSLLNDSICSFFKIESNRLLGFSMNHSSSELISKPKMLLKMNSSFLFHFKEPLSIQSILSSLSQQNKIISTDSTSFSIGDDVYFFHQLSSNSFYIGMQEFDPSFTTVRNDIFYIKGAPSHLTEVNGEGIVRRFISIIPLFHASEAFSNSIQSIDLTTTKNNTISGEIKFKSGKKSMRELIRFVLLWNE